MPHTITDKAARQAIFATRDLFIDSYLQFSEAWLSRMSLRLTAAENTAHPYGDELSDFATAFSTASTTNPDTPLIAVT